MQTITMGANEARDKMRDVIDHADKGGAVVLERYQRPMAVVISYKRFKQMEAEHLELLRRWAADADRDGTWVDWEKAKASLLEAESV